MITNNLLIKLVKLVPEAGIEPARDLVPRDFKSGKTKPHNSILIQLVTLHFFGTNIILFLNKMAHNLLFLPFVVPKFLAF
jgi:hypothetical protein